MTVKAMDGGRLPPTVFMGRLGHLTGLAPLYLTSTPTPSGAFLRIRGFGFRKGRVWVS